VLRQLLLPLIVAAIILDCIGGSGSSNSLPAAANLISVGITLS
jgi:hypothetical protein